MGRDHGALYILYNLHEKLFPVYKFGSIWTTLYWYTEKDSIVLIALILKDGSFDSCNSMQHKLEGVIQKNKRSCLRYILVVFLSPEKLDNTTHMFYSHNFLPKKKKISHHFFFSLKAWLTKKHFNFNFQKINLLT